MMSFQGRIGPGASGGPWQLRYTNSSNAYGVGYVHGVTSIGNVGGGPVVPGPQGHPHLMTPAEKKRLVFVTTAITTAVTALLLAVLWITVSGVTGG